MKSSPPKVPGQRSESSVKPNTTLLTGNKWWNHLPVWGTQTDRIANMSEDLGVAQADKGKFTEIGVCGEIFEGMQRRS